MKSITWTTILALCTGAAADVVLVPASRDNTLYENTEGIISNGAGESVFAGKTNAGVVRRSLLRFDVAAAVPAGSTVTSTTLSFNVSRSISSDLPMSFHRVLVDWGEGPSVALGEGGRGTLAEPGDATWLHRFYPDQFWALPGGQPGVEFQAEPSVVAMVGAIGSYTVGSTPGLVADVQAWLNAPADNFGWMVIGDESTLGTAKRIDSRENVNPAVRPMLAVEYSRPCYPNCDGSTGTPSLTSNDFQCFLNRFAAGDTYANCDASTGTPTLTANDFQCFLNSFAAGCT